MIPDNQLPRSRRPRKHPVQERSQFTVEAILDAAVQVFERHGYAAGTTARIAERAGVAVGSLYQYFPNKDAILVAVALRHLAEGETALTDLLAEAVTTTLPLDQLARRFVEAMLALHVQHPALHRMLFEQVALPQVVWGAVAALEQQMTLGITELLRTHPDVRVADPYLAAALVVQIIEAATHRMVLHPSPGLSRAACVDELVVLIAGYLGGQGLIEG